MVIQVTSCAFFGEAYFAHEDVLPRSAPSFLPRGIFVFLAELLEFYAKIIGILAPADLYVVGAEEVFHC